MAVEIIMPKLGLTMTEGTIVTWLAQDGDPVEKGEPVLEILTDKTNMEVESPESGRLSIMKPEGAVIPILEVIGYVLGPGESLPAVAGGQSAPSLDAKPAILNSGAASVSTSLAASSPDAAACGSVETGRLRVSPAARRVARQLGLPDGQLGTIAGTGPGGRIVIADVERAAANLKSSPAPTVAAPTPAPSGYQTTIPASGNAEVIPLTGVRGIIAERMTQSVREAPQFHLSVDICMDRITKLRQALLPYLEASQGIRLSYTEMLVKVVSKALSEFPMLNAYVTDREVLVQPQVNMGVAVAADAGLIVPVVRDTATKPLTTVCVEQKDLVGKVRSKSLSPDDLSGGTFTLSNLGMFGVDSFAAIVNPPQSGILAVGRAKDVLVMEGRSIVVQSVASFTLTCDHRAVDGVYGAKFLGRVKAIMESDELLEVCRL